MAQEKPPSLHFGLDPRYDNVSVKPAESTAERNARIEIEKARALYGLWMGKFVAITAAGFLALIGVVAIVAAFFAPHVEQRTGVQGC